MDILGINERNLSFIRPYNKRKAVKLADDKIRTKKLLIKTGIPTPKMYQVIENVIDLEKFDWNKLPASFVVKPNRGFGGGGILILSRRVKKEKFIKTPLEKRSWFTSSDEEYPFEKLKGHIMDIIDGNYSLSGLPDAAFIERKLNTDPIFKDYVRKGLPDIRVIVFNKVPVMAMLRLPTESSKGRANITQGAIGVGIDIGTGMTTTAMVKIPRHKVIEKNPDTGKELGGLKIPHWNKILEMSVEAQIASDLGFLGVDIAIDRKKGPEILEINARSGLDIQIANLEGLATRLKRIKGLKVKSVSHGVRIGKDLFGGDIERRVEEISGLEVIGVIEKISILNKKGTRKYQIDTKIDTGAGITAIDKELAIKLGFKDAIEYYESFKIKEVMDKEEMEDLSKKKIWKKLRKHPDITGVAKITSSHGASYRIEIPLVFNLAGQKISTKASVLGRRHLNYQMIIGRRDLKNFLVDPYKNSPKK